MIQHIRKDLGKRTISDKVLQDRAFEIARNRNYDGHQRELGVCSIRFLIRK